MTTAMQTTTDRLAAALAGFLDGKPQRASAMAHVLVEAGWRHLESPPADPGDTIESRSHLRTLTPYTALVDARGEYWVVVPTNGPLLFASPFGSELFPAEQLRMPVRVLYRRPIPDPDGVWMAEAAATVPKRHGLDPRRMKDPCRACPDQRHLRFEHHRGDGPCDYDGCPCTSFRKA